MSSSNSVEEAVEDEAEEIVISSEQCYNNTIRILTEALLVSREAFLGSQNMQNAHFSALHLEELPAEKVNALLDDILRGDVATELFELFALVSQTPHPDDNEDEIVVGHHQEKAASIVSFHCQECNQVYDIPYPMENGEHGVRFEDDSHPHLDINAIGSTEWTPTALHRLTLLLQVVNAVLGSPTLKSNTDRNDLEQKLLLADVGQRQGISRAALKYFGSDGYWMDGSRFPILDVVVNFIHTRNYHYPLLAQNAAALLSLLIIRRPATILATKQYDQFICCILTHLMQLCDQMQGNVAVHSVRFSVLGYLNILPTMWNLTAADAARMSERGVHETVMMLLQAFIQFAGLVLICARGECACYMADEPPDYFQQRALFLWTCPVRHCFAQPQLVDDHPLSLAIVATLELLMRWRRFMPMTALMDEFSFITKLEAVRLILVLKPSLHHGNALFSDLVRGTKNAESYTSVFRNDMARCHFEACPETGPQLRACSGCTVKHHSIAWYCCADHQRQHWDAHKPFCRTVKKASSQRG